MADEKDTLTRRGFLGVGSAAVAATGLLSIGKTGSARQQDDSKYKAKSDRSASGPGPTNPVLDAANSDSVNPPATDSGGVPTFKYPFSFSHKRLHEGGWSREVTVRELAVSKTIAGVNMRLTAGGVRELHWHPRRSGLSCSTAQRELLA
jgi:oxalate decarboxylase